jgi:hypothetical protein
LVRRLVSAVPFDYTVFMCLRRFGFLLIGTLFYAPFYVSAQNTAVPQPLVSEAAASAGAAESAAPDETGDTTGPAAFSLIPLLEAAFSGELRWRPDWPVVFPPDAFCLAGESSPGAPGGSLAITLSGETEIFSFHRNDRGRLDEFPFFFSDAWYKIQAAYADSGAILSMNISAETSWTIEFPPDFFPYNDALAPVDGVFPPIRVAGGEAVCFVIILENPAFISETWYDQAGNLMAYFKARIHRDFAGLRPGRGWRVQSLQIRDQDGLRAEDYFFDAAGNLSEVRREAGVFSALYQGKRPRYWERPDGSPVTLQWDRRGLLVGRKPGGAADSPAEYRYEYELDTAGNWLKRQDIAIISRFGVFVAQTGKAWSRTMRYPDGSRPTGVLKEAQ